MGQQTGTNSYDIFYLNGNVQQLSLTITNPYNGKTLAVDDEYNLNSDSYEGLAGVDILYMSHVGDALFVEDQGVQMISNIEYIAAGDGGDLIVLASDHIVLDDMLIHGGEEGDIIWANSGNDKIYGYTGDDILDGGPGDDKIYGGTDNDLLEGGTGNDELYGEEGADLLRGDSGDDTLYYSIDGAYNGGWGTMNVGSPGIEGTDKLIWFNNTLNRSLDIFDGGEGFDTLIMTNSHDVLFMWDPYNDVHAEGDVFRVIDIEQINAGDGDDIIDFTHWEYAYGDVIIYGENGNDDLWSSSGNDHLDGGIGDDYLWAGAGNDYLLGDEGDDILFGGPNADMDGALDIVTEEHLFAGTLFPDDIPRGHNNMPAAESMGVAAGNLAVDFETTATISFVSEDAGFSNTVGAYTIGEDGTILSTHIAFENTNATQEGAEFSFAVGGDHGTELGFFVIANGYNKNQMFKDLDFENGTLSFVYNHGENDERLAKITDDGRDVNLVFEHNDGSVITLKNHIYHTNTQGEDVPLNTDGDVHVISGLVDENDPATLRIGFEDLHNLGDADFNDVVFDIHIEGYKAQTLTIDDSDYLHGGAGDDLLNGGVGNDILIGGTGTDILYGDHGADIFAFETLDGSIDQIKDFSLTDGDTLNITNLLEGYDVLTDAIGDFVRLTDTSEGTVLAVNTDGSAGGAFTTVAVIEGGLGGLMAGELLDAGTLVINQDVI